MGAKIEIVTIVDFGTFLGHWLMYGAERVKQYAFLKGEIIVYCITQGKFAYRNHKYVPLCKR